MKTWNLRVFGPENEHAVRRLIRDADDVCPTQTWTEIALNLYWLCLNCNATDANGQIIRRHVVAILYKSAVALLDATTYESPYFQCIHGTLRGIPILACYARATIPREELAKFFSIAHRWLRGPGLLIEDLNARHPASDDYTNRQGSMLHKWAQRHNFLTHKPPSPICVTAIGQSRVDIIMHHGPEPPYINTLPSSPSLTIDRSRPS